MQAKRSRTAFPHRASSTGVQDVDKIVGQLDDEAATNITGNIAWEGTQLTGNEPTEQPIKWEDVSTEKMTSKGDLRGSRLGYEQGLGLERKQQAACPARL